MPELPRLPEEAPAALATAIKSLAVGTRNPNHIQELSHGVIANINKKVGSNKCDLWQFLVSNLDYRDKEIIRHLRQANETTYPPEPEVDETEGRFVYPQIWIWGTLVATQLLRNSENRCRCFDRYSSVGSQKKYDSMYEACERNHSIDSFEVVDNDGQELSDQEVMNRLRKAVDGYSDLRKRMEGHFRDFGNSMFCSVFTTPRELGLFLVRRTNNDGEKVVVLVEEDELRESDSRQVGQRYAWYCGNCDQQVGVDGHVCSGNDCVWKPEAIEAGSSVSKPLKKKVNYCDNAHFWPRRRLESCPTCGSSAIDAKEIRIYFPTQ